MLGLVQTAIALATAMLAGSLFVTALVQFFRRTFKFDGDALDEFLRAVYVGFRSFHEGANVKDCEQWWEEASPFVEGVLASPQIHQDGFAQSPLTSDAAPEYVSADDLACIVYRQALTPNAADPKMGTAAIYTIPWIKNQDPHELPREWFPFIAKNPMPYATTRQFAIYLERWFTTLDKGTTQKFKLRMKRMSMVLAALVVVLMNMDGFQLARDFYASEDGRDAFIAQADNLARTAGRLGIPNAPLPEGEKSDTTTKELSLEMQKMGLILTTQSVHVGWRDSPIAKAFCAYRRECPDLARPSGGAFAVTVAEWFAGLLFSFAMLCLGAPFWYTTLQSALRWTNEGRAVDKPDPPPPSPSPGNNSPAPQA